MESTEPLKNEPLLAGISDPEVKRLAALIPRFEQALFSLLGRNTAPSPAQTLVDFAHLPLRNKQQVINIIQSQLEFVNEAVTNSVPAFDEFSMVRMAMRKLNLLSDDNVLEKVDPTDVVEIIDSNMIQVYRSYSCFGLCNYSISELVTYPWYELYERPSWVTERLMKLGMPVMRGQRSFQDLENTVPAYVLKESRTTERAAFLVQEKFYARMISSLTRESYLLSVKKIKPLETQPAGFV